MRKFAFRVLLILTLPLLGLILFLHHDHTPIFNIADSGFDSSYDDYYDGGSWDDDYDSSWGDSSGSYGGSYYTSSGSIDGETFAILMVFLVVFVGSIIAIRCYSVSSQKQKRKRESTQRQINQILLYDFGLSQGDGRNTKLIKSAYLNYVEIQKAWMNRDLTPIRHLLTDEMYNMYQMQVETLIQDNQINIMSDFEFVCGGVSCKESINNTETIKIILCVKCKDYIKDAIKNKVVNGDKNATITYIYELTFVRDNNASNAINCPACGAKVKTQMSAKCPYCNNSLLLTSSNITMSNKSILYQFKG